jgi:hypothetical protein
MRFISKSALLALMATLVLGAVAVSAASAALPEFQKGGAPLREAVTFTATGGENSMETAGGVEGTFDSSSFSGEIKPSGEIAHVTITFANNKTGYPCSNITGAPNWGLVTKELKGTLGYLSKTSKTVGSLFTPVAQPFATCKRGTISGELDGSVLGKITPVDTASTHFTITYQETAGVQALEKFEGSEVLHDLEVNLGKGTEGIGVSAVFTLTTSKAIELKA